MNESLNRRQFMSTAAALGAGLYVGRHAAAQGGGNDVINVALIGAGDQGQVLTDAVLRLGRDSGIRFVAVCDIWRQMNLTRVSRRLDAYKAFGHKGTPYVDYKEMLDKEEDLDAVIVASPDFWHADHTVDSLKKGLHVYCEKSMAHTIEDARRMVKAAQETGKLLQIGHQRRSNPRYLHCFNKLIKEHQALGRITAINGQWNRSRASTEDFGWPEGREIDEATLNKYGFRDMHQFRNWRWFKGLGGGPIIDLGGHQIDIYSWFLEATPTSVIASGGTDYWQHHEWYDSVMAIYEYQTAAGKVRAFYQTLSTNSANGYYESFMGDKGTLVISEAANRGNLYRENWVPEDEWQPLVDKGYINRVEGVAPPAQADPDVVLDVREGTVAAAEYSIPVSMTVPYHQPHLVNFFDAIRGTAKLACPGEVGYKTAVSLLRVNEAVEKGTRLEFKPEDFAV